MAVFSAACGDGVKVEDRGLILLMILLWKQKIISADKSSGQKANILPGKPRGSSTIELMALNKFYLKMFLILGLTACSGFSPGGPGGAVGGAGPNNLAPPGSTGGGDNPGTPAGSGVPGTQQGEPGIGLPGGVSFDVQVHIMENGRERRCDGSLAPFGSAALPPSANSMAKGLNQFNGDLGNAQILDDPVGPEPTVSLNYVPDVGVASGPQTKQAVCTQDKGWLANFFFGFACTEDRCTTFRVSTHATLPLDNLPDLTSRTFEGPPFPHRAGNQVPIPIHLSIVR